MQTALIPATAADRPVLARLAQLCLHDLSASEPLEIGEDGLFPSDFLAPYGDDPNHRAYLLRAGPLLAGFALVNRSSRLAGPFAGSAVALFFVLRRYRRQGVGRAAARLLFDATPGLWEVATPAANVPAAAFWRSTVDSYTAGRYHEHWLQAPDWSGPVQRFNAPP
jgi:predicted acetyltransferase